jgi:hypothetical protein
MVQRKRGLNNNEDGKVDGNFKSSNTGETSLPNGFSSDDISEIDADIDLTTPLPLPSVSRNDVSFPLYFTTSILFYFIFSSISNNITRIHHRPAHMEI